MLQAEIGKAKESIEEAIASSVAAVQTSCREELAAERSRNLVSKSC
jgi:hypothetical protein